MPKWFRRLILRFFPMQMTVGAQYLQLCFLGGRHPGEAMPSPSPSASRRACFRCSACGLILPTKQAASDHLVTHTRKPLPSQNSVPPPPAVVQHVSRRLPELSSSSSSSPSSFFWEQCLSMEDERQPLSVLGGWLGSTLEAAHLLGSMCMGIFAGSWDIILHCNLKQADSLSGV